EASGRKFGERVARNVGNRDKLEDAYADVVGEVADIAKRSRKVTVPNDKEARAFHEAFLAYLDFEEHMVDYDFHKIMTHAARRDERWLDLTPTREMWEMVLDSLKLRYRRREGVSDDDVAQVERVLREWREPPSHDTDDEEE